MKSICLFTLSALACLSLALPAVAQTSKPAAPKKAKHVNPVIVIETSQGNVELELFEKQAPKTVANFIALAEGTKEFKNLKTNKMEKRPFFDGLNFHRCMDGFMAQGGCPLGNGGGGPGYSFEDEINAKSFGFDKEKMMLNGGQPNRLLGVQTRQDWTRKIMNPLFKQMNISSQADLDAKKKEVDEKLASMTLLEGLELSGFKYNDKLPASTKPKRGTIAMANTGPNTNGSQFFISTVDNDYLAGKHTVFGKVTKGLEIVDKIVKLGDAKKTNPPQITKIISIRKKVSSPKK